MKKYMMHFLKDLELHKGTKIAKSNNTNSIKDRIKKKKSIIMGITTKKKPIMKIIAPLYI
jgi:hypothetical protein